MAPFIVRGALQNLGVPASLASEHDGVTDDRDSSTDRSFRDLRSSRRRFAAL